MPPVRSLLSLTLVAAALCPEVSPDDTLETLRRLARTPETPLRLTLETPPVRGRKTGPPAAPVLTAPSNLRETSLSI